MPKDNSIKHVLIIGSGPIIIGQACEFDYSGSQASRSLREEGIKVSLINSNPATIMTDPVTADQIYLWPLNSASIEKILIENIEKGTPIDSVLPTMGGQTALNLAKEVSEIGIWQKYGVKMIGVDIEAIDRAENRELFRQLMVELGIGVAKSHVANSFLEGKEFAQEIGFPLVIRPSFTLGGTGGGFVQNKDELDAALMRGLTASPTHEVLVEKAVLGWKEFELELLRDANDNVVIICVVENLDPMGVHTGDSITVAPAMTLSDTSYQNMRNLSIKMMRAMGNFAGGCNVQFAQDPYTEELIAVEINPRVSRSSALASKATGYPIAKIAAKLAIGYHLDELSNQITKSTSAYFEPALDYVVVKMPRWNFDKFPGADDTLGLQMKSVGEVMSIGRSFQEALQKACQSLENNKIGLSGEKGFYKSSQEIIESLAKPHWDRIFNIKKAMDLGVPVRTIHNQSLIDPWFLMQIQELVKIEKELRRYQLNNIPKKLMIELKQKGYSDLQIANTVGNCTEEEVYNYRRNLGIKRTYKLVDTCAAEFEANTPYYYSTFEDENESVRSEKRKLLF
jgi:carbamoyl-phosphate synthase large subunit